MWLKIRPHLTFARDSCEKQKSPSSSARHWGWKCYPSKMHFPLPCFHHLIFAFIQKIPGRTRWWALQLHTEYTFKQSLLEPKWTLFKFLLRAHSFSWHSASTFSCCISRKTLRYHFLTLKLTLFLTRCASAAFIALSNWSSTWRANWGVICCD